MNSAGSRTLVLALLSGLAGCATPQATVPSAHAETLFVARSPQDVLTALVIGAVGHGYRIHAESADAVQVDLGTRVVEVGAAGSGRDRSRLVHGTALYLVSSRGSGSLVTLLARPSYYDAPAGVWRAGPDDLAPGRTLLLEVASKAPGPPAGRP